MAKVARYWKAFAAFVAPGCALLIVDSKDGWSSSELSVAALTCVVSAAAVWAAPKNAPKDGA